VKRNLESEARENALRTLPTPTPLGMGSMTPLPPTTPLYGGGGGAPETPLDSSGLFFPGSTPLVSGIHDKGITMTPLRWTEHTLLSNMVGGGSLVATPAANQNNTSGNDEEEEDEEEDEDSGRRTPGGGINIGFGHLTPGFGPATAYTSSSSSSSSTGVVPTTSIIDDAQTKLALPFIVITTGVDTMVQCEMTESRNEVSFQFSDTFEINDDAEVLKRLGLHQATEDELSKLFGAKFLPYLPRSCYLPTSSSSSSSSAASSSSSSSSS
jgi:hypothetical protein